MGLEDKRARKAAEEWLPKRDKELQDLCGGEVPYEVDWASFEGDPKGLQWLEHNGPQQVGSAIRVICKDDLGKEAVREGIKKIVLKNVEAADSKKVTFEDGVLEVTCAYAKSPQGRFDYKVIQACIEKGL